MRHLYRAGCFIAFAMLTVSPAAAAQCRIELYPPIAVTMKGLRPMVWARINGVRARFFVDTGAFWSLLSPAARAEYNLTERTTPEGYYVRGVNGYTDVGFTTVQTFALLTVPFHRLQFLVGGNDFPSGAAGVVGENILRASDVEYDFADGVMRFIKTRHCGDRPLAYWATHRPFGTVKLSDTTVRRPDPIGHATVNGKRIRVIFDTGTARSMLTLYGARRLGITPSSPGVKLLGKFPGGIAQKWLKVWIAPVALFQIGDEKIEHTHLLIGDVRRFAQGVDMLLGSDFFLSHRVLVANGQHKLYFTYNGGPVFDLGQRYWIKRAGAAPVLAGPGAASAAAPHGSSAPAAVRAGAGKAPSTPAASVGNSPPSGVPAQAGKLAREGMAYLSEGQYAPALADLDRACRLEPRNPEYRYRRGEVYWADRRPAEALADFNAAIKMRPDFYQAHLARASLLLSWKHAPSDAGIQIRADINIVALLAPDESEVRLPLARLYARTRHYSAAIREIDQWIYYHGHDALLPVAWNERCWIRAEAGRQLHKALEDCNHALGRLPSSADVLDSRGLVYLRLGRLRHSIADYDAALRVDPKIATSLYGRGLAELREGKKAAGRSDLAAAARLNHGIAERFARMGLRP